jgi:creatinine amidohydrolase/Fe(II)-dependent formamide hydrolase-like protein
MTAHLGDLAARSPRPAGTQLLIVNGHGGNRGILKLQANYKATSASTFARCIWVR